LFEQHGKQHRETQQIKQEDQRIYAIILTDLNQEDKNIKKIIEGKNTWNFQRYTSIVPASIVFEKRQRDASIVFKRDKERQWSEKM